MSKAYRDALAAKPNAKRETILKDIAPKFEKWPGRTKQAFKDSTDINKILAKANKTGTLSHLQKHGAVYGDFADAPTDLLEAHGRLARGQAVFDELPAEIRREFNQSMFEFFEYVNDPANVGRLEELLPGLAEPGRQRMQVGSVAASLDAASGPEAASMDATGTPTGGNGGSASGGDTGGQPA